MVLFSDGLGGIRFSEFRLEEMVKRKRFEKGQAGFFSIQLLAVVVVLGLLAVVVFFRVDDLKKEAAEKDVRRVADSLTAGFVLNYSACFLDQSDCVDVTDCGDGRGLVEKENLPDGIYIEPKPLGDTFGDPATCVVGLKRQGTEYTAEFLAIRAFAATQ